MVKSQFLKGENRLLELENFFTELKDREINYREVKIKRDIEELFLNQVFYL